MTRYGCPDCQTKAVEKRAPNLARYVKLRRVDGIHDPFVCRNGECQWTGQASDLGDDVNPEEPDYDHYEATNWNMESERPKQTDGGIGVEAHKGFTGNNEVVEVQCNGDLVDDETGDAVISLPVERAKRLRDDLDATLKALEGSHEQ